MYQPTLTDLQRDHLNGILQYGRSVTARVAGGFSCTVYRVQENAPPTGVLDGSPYIIGYPAKFERTTKRDDLENELFDLLTFVAMADVRPLMLGDFIIEIQTGTLYAFAQSRPTKQNIVVRCESTAVIRRPVDVPVRNADAVPNNGLRVVSVNDLPTEATVDEPTSDVLTLRNGVHAFTPAISSPIAAKVPIGVQPTSRARPGHKEGLPTSTDIERFIVYIPPLFPPRSDSRLSQPGVVLRDNDELEVQDGSGIVYVVDQVYSSGTIGTVGTTALVTKAGV